MLKYYRPFEQLEAENALEMFLHNVNHTPMNQVSVESKFLLKVYYFMLDTKLHSSVHDVSDIPDVIHKL